MAEADRRTSPWPILVAVGLAVGELGVLFGLVPIAVGGVVLFGASAAGVIRDAGLATTASRPLAAVGTAIGAASLAVWRLRADALAGDAFLAAAATDAVAARAAVVFGAAAVLLGAGLLAGAYARWR